MWQCGHKLKKVAIGSYFHTLKTLWPKIHRLQANGGQRSYSRELHDHRVKEFRQNEISDVSMFKIFLGLYMTLLLMIPTLPYGQRVILNAQENLGISVILF